MADLLSVIHKSIHIENLHGRFVVRVFVDGKLSASYRPCDTREEAEQLARRLADNDCPRCG